MKQQVIELKGEKVGVKFEQIFTSMSKAMNKYRELKPLDMTLTLRTYNGITIEEYHDLKLAAIQAVEGE